MSGSDVLHRGRDSLGTPLWVVHVAGRGGVPGRLRRFRQDLRGAHVVPQCKDQERGAGKRGQRSTRPVQLDCIPQLPVCQDHLCPLMENSAQSATHQWPLLAIFHTGFFKQYSFKRWASVSVLSPAPVGMDTFKLTVSGDPATHKDKQQLFTQTCHKTCNYCSLCTNRNKCFVFRKTTTPMSTLHMGAASGCSNMGHWGGSVCTGVLSHTLRLFNYISWWGNDPCVHWVALSVKMLPVFKQASCRSSHTRGQYKAMNEGQWLEDQGLSRLF